MSPLKVISQQPPGGRCTLYARYADAIAGELGWSHTIVHDECRDAHGEGFPSLWVRDMAIQPADGAILTPEDICDWLRQHGVDAPRADALQQRLQSVLDNFLENWKPGNKGERCKSRRWRYGEQRSVRQHFRDCCPPSGAAAPFQRPMVDSY